MTGTAAKGRAATRRVVLGITVVCCCAAQAAEAGTLGVVELFTSQGCSSCPPADKVLGEIANDPDVVALSFAVDYWDYLGWRDTFAKPEFTRRQRAYADARGDRSVYTPQVVVNGRDHVVGTDKHRILDRLSALKAAGEGMAVEVEARIEGDRMIVHVPAGTLPAGARASVWIASYRQPATVEIGEGENAGHAITYVNVVERWQVLGMWDGKDMTVELPLSDVASDRSAGCAVVLQSKADGRPGPILGATKVQLTVN